MSDHEELIIEKGEADTAMLITMATHGRSGLNRFLLGSVAEKVLRGTVNPLLLVRATEEARPSGEATLKSIIVPLDGSKLAETVLPMAAGLAKKLDLEVVLFRAYTVPYAIYGGVGVYAVDRDQLIAAIDTEVIEYLEEKVDALRKAGLEKVSCAAKEGLSADEIINFARRTPNNLIALCSHGRSGVMRWMLGSVTETVVRHCGGPVLIVRAS